MPALLKESWIQRKSKSHSKRKHEDENVKLLQYSICSKQIVSQKNLKLHIQTVHENVKPFHCNLCKHKSSYKKDFGGYACSRWETYLSLCLCSILISLREPCNM